MIPESRTTFLRIPHIKRTRSPSQNRCSPSGISGSRALPPDECQGRALAASTLRGLIEKERSIPIGTGLERFTELAKGIYSGYIVLMPVSTFGKVIRVDFFHTIQREIVGSLVFEQADGYLRVKVVELKVF